MFATMKQAMQKTGLAFALGAALAIASAPAAFAFAPGALQSDMKALLVQKNADGTENLVQTEEAAPGDMIEYQITYTNTGAEALSGLVVNGPMPQNTSYVGGSARTVAGEALEVSIDGGQTWETEPVIRREKNEYGQIVEVVIPPTDYTNVRWISSQAVQPASSIGYSYRVTVD